MARLAFSMVHNVNSGVVPGLGLAVGCGLASHSIPSRFHQCTKNSPSIEKLRNKNKVLGRSSFNIKLLILALRCVAREGEGRLNVTIPSELYASQQ